jgi:hypothetical protein
MRVVISLVPDMILVSQIGAPRVSQPLIHNWGELLIGAGLGALIGLFVTLFIQPLLQESSEGLLVSALSRIKPWRSKANLDGDWAFIWWLADGEPRLDEQVSVRLKTVGKRVVAKFEWRGRTYHLLGRRESTEYITGTYVDEREGVTFNGAFQLRILPNELTLDGRWIGFN